jgi:hypothetical protein
MTFTVMECGEIVAPRAAERTRLAVRDARAAVSSRVYLPAFSIPVLAGVLVGIGWSSGWGGAAFAG